MHLQIGCVVEGQGDVAAVPILLRRVAQFIDPNLWVTAPKPIRITRSRLVGCGELERAVELAARNVSGHGGILVLIDSDKDCPAELGPQLLCRSRQARSDLPISVVLAKCEFESWLVAAAESLRGQSGLATELTAPEAPEGIRGAKEWLSRNMPPGYPYRETLHQAKLTNAFDLEAAALRAPSFGRLVSEIKRLCGELARLAG